MTAQTQSLTQAQAQAAVAALHESMAQVQRLLGDAPQFWPAAPVRAAVQQALQHFVAQHAALFDFGNFPLPTDAGQALACYTLHSNDADPAHGLCLRVNSIAPGMHSAVHDHGTWALILGLQGEEINQVYGRADANANAAQLATPAPTADPQAPPQALPALAGLKAPKEVRIGPGQALWLHPSQFHSIHTPGQRPALQMHLYGADPDHCTGRHAVDPASGRWVALPPFAD